MEMNRLLGHQHIEDYPRNSIEMRELVELLSRDVKDHVFCEPCLKLHKLDKLVEHTSKGRLSRTLLPYLEIEDAFWTGKLFGPNFSSVGFRLAMRTHQYNPSDEQLLRVLGQDTIMSLSTEHVRQSRADVRIFEGVMYHRLQVVVLSASPESSIYKGHPYIEICRHLSFWTDERGICIRLNIHDYIHDLIFPSKTGTRIWALDWDVLEKKGPKGWVFSEILQCNYCRTDLCIDFKNYPGRGMAIFVMRWKELGYGPDTDMWEQHVGRSWLRSPRTTTIAALPDGEEEVRFDAMLLEPGSKEKLFEYHEYCKWLVARKNGLEQVTEETNTCSSEHQMEDWN